MRLANLTGHPIYIVGNDGTHTMTIGECKTIPALRAYSEGDEYLFNYGKAPVYRKNYELDITLKEINAIYSDYDGIIVSKLVADVLKEYGFHKPVYIVSGTKRSSNGAVLGATALSKYI